LLLPELLQLEVAVGGVLYGKHYQKLFFDFQKVYQKYPKNGFWVTVMRQNK